MLFDCRAPRAGAFVVAATMAVIVGAGFTGLSASATVTDTQPPTVNSITMQADHLDVSDSDAHITITADLTDDASGVQFANASVAGPNGFTGGADLVRNDAGEWVGVATVPRYSGPGDWSMSSVYVADMSNNQKVYSADQLVGRVTPTVLTFTGMRDSSAPTLVGIDLSTTSVAIDGAGQTVTPTLHITDDLSGFGYAELTLSSPSGVATTAFFESDERTSGTATDGIYTASTQPFSIPSDAEEGQWTITHVFLSDQVNNTVDLLADSYPAGSVTSVDVTNTNPPPPPDGVIQGVVATPGDGGTVPVVGAPVMACQLYKRQSCASTHTDAAGAYSLPNLPDNGYHIYVSAPTGSTLNTGESVMTASLYTFAQHATTQNFSLTLPVAMPTGVVLNGQSSSDVSPVVPVTSNTAPINITVDRPDCAGGSGTVTVTMADGTILPAVIGGDLTESPSSPGHFTASIPPPPPSPYPTHGTATVSMSFTCGGTTAAPTTFTLYVDPSGAVQDMNTGNGIAGATVTLLRSDTLAGPFTAAPSGSDIMSPSNRANPDTSDSTGHYGWDVIAGYYKVQAQAPDCYAPNSYSNASNTVQPVVTSMTQQIPPSVTNQNLLLDCTNIKPVASFTQPTSTAVGTPVHFDATPSKDANGSVASYSWNFGDGTTGSGASPSHTYATSGSFTPTLTVTDDQGLASLLKTGSAIAVSGGAPGTVGNLSATSSVHGVNLSWSAPADNGSPITGYTVDVSPGGQHLTPTGTSVTVSGLTANTSYTFTVRAVSALGSSPPATTSAVAGAAANKPTVTITAKPVALTYSTSGIVRFTTAVDSSVSLTSVTCSVDGGAETACASPNTLSGLADGSHTVVVTATDSDGNHGSASTQWVVDTTPAIAGMVQPASTTTLVKRFAVSWGGADANGIASFDVQYSKAAWNGKFGAPTLWMSGTTATSSSFIGVPGYEYCFSVRAQDKAGNASGYSATKCTAVPLDDRALNASAGWAKVTGKTFFLGTAMQTAAKGKTLTRKGAIAGRAVLYVDKGKGFGSLVVLYNGKVVKTVSLASTRTLTKVAIALPKVTKATTIVIKTTTAKKVQIDGLLLARI